MKIYRFKSKHEKNSLFTKILLLVGILQAALMIVFGGWIVKTILPQEEVIIQAVKTTPPDVTKERTQIIRGRMDNKPSAPPRIIRVETPTMINPPDMDFNMDVGVPGGEGGFGGELVVIPDEIKIREIAIPDIDIFDTPINSDRVFIAFEVSEEVMRDEMGGFDAFNVIKDEIKSLVKSLPATMVFNVMAFDAHHKILYQTCFPGLVQASEPNKESLVKWMDSINPDTENIGLKWNSPKEYKLRYPQPPYPQISFHYDGHHKWEVAGRYGVYQAAIESKAGSIYILTRSWPEPEKYFMSLSPEAEKRYMDQWEKNVKDYERNGKKVATDERYREWISSTETARKKARAWLEAENKRREEKGIPKRVITDMLALAHELKIPFPEKPVTKNDLRPAVPKFKTYKRNTLLASYEPILKATYDENGLERPRTNIMLLMGRKDESEAKYFANIKSWSKINNSGTSRIIRAGRPVSEYN